MKEVIFIVDMIRGFCEKGNLADPYIMNIVPNINKLIEDKPEAKVICICDKHEKNSKELEHFPEHCIDTEECELVDDFKTKAIYFKNSTNAFFLNDLDDWEEEIQKLEKPKNIYIVGCCTDICIMNFAITLKNFCDQRNLSVNIIVPKNCVETYDSPEHSREEWNDMAIKFMKLNGVKTI